MELAPDATTLVVAGAWNAAILTPAWILRHGVGQAAEADQARVQVFLPALQGGAFEFPRITLNQFAYIVRPDNLVVMPIGDPPNAFRIAEDAVARILEALPHTPISGVGHNFEYRDPTPAPEHVEVFTTASQDIVDDIPRGWDSETVAISTTFRNVAAAVLINMHRTFDAGVLSVKFNFHHPVSSTAEAVQVLRGEGGRERMTQNLALARELIASLYERQIP